MSEGVAPAANAEAPADAVEPSTPYPVNVDAFDTEGARLEIIRLRSDREFGRRYVQGGELERDIMRALHAKAFPDPFAERGSLTPTPEPTPTAKSYEPLISDTGQGGVQAHEYAHLPDAFFPPEKSGDYQLPPGTLDAIGFDGFKEVQGWLHAAALPVGVAKAIADRAESLGREQQAPLQGNALLLAEYACDAELGRMFGDRLDTAFAAAEKLEAAMDRRFPGLMDRLQALGVLTDPTCMAHLMEHAMRIYGPRASRK